MGNGDGVGVKQLNMMLSLTKTIFRNKDEKRFKEYIKIWLYEAIDLPNNFNHILAGLFILVKEIEYDFKNQTKLLAKLEEKISSIPDDVAQQMSQYYGSQLEIQ